MLTIVATLLVAVTAIIRPAGLMLAVGFGLSLGWQALRHRTTWLRAVAITLALGVPASIGVGAFMKIEQSTATEESARTYLSNFGDSARSPLASYLEGGAAGNSRQRTRCDPRHVQGVQRVRLA